MTTAPWKVTSASRRGSSHGEDGPNQDACASARVTDIAGVVTWVAAVSDGHGGRRYVRSQTGARLAVNLAVAEASRALEQASAGDPGLLRTLVPGLVEAWRAEVAAHQARHPFTPEEVIIAGVTSLDEHPVVAYGATLLMAVVSTEAVLLAQIGDGDALVRMQGKAAFPVPGDSRLHGNETTSLCLESAVADFRYAELASAVELVMLASDGYGNSFASGDWSQELVGDFVDFLERRGFDAFAARLPDWLEESAQVGGDDVTAVVLIRDRDTEPGLTPVTEPVAQPDATEASAADDEPSDWAAPAHRETGPKNGVLRIALGVITLVGIAVGAALWEREPWLAYGAAGLTVCSAALFLASLARPPRHVPRPFDPGQAGVSGSATGVAEPPSVDREGEMPPP
ncbi:hypothetical protein NOCA2150146 [metagenome]|uniref:PPM-type phosphatase domain-containing protein n=1 Tax=metagenome TaxID=256318 RepID=A0A2P2BXD6_9ZZZZ